MVTRSTKIKSRVFRNLGNLGIKNSDVLDEEIYDEMQNAQNHIVSEALPDKIVTITLLTDIDTYRLTSGNGAKNIASVKVIDRTADIGTIEIMTERRFVDAKSSSITTGKPQIACIVDDNIIFYPKPDSSLNNKALSLMVYLSSSSGIIDKDNEPELPEYWDKAIELYATSQFLTGQDRVQWKNEFAGELNRLKPIPNREHHNYRREKISGW